MPKLFITGISGLIGRTIAQRAVTLGYDVTGVDRTGKRIAGIKVVKADIRDTKRMLELTKKSDYVIHVAAITSNLEFSKNIISERYCTLRYGSAYEPTYACNE